MNKKLITFIIILFVVNLQLIAQKTGTLRGKIIDESTGETLIGVNVFKSGTTIGTSTDFDGNYSLHLPEGKHNIKISYISYDTKIFEDIEIVSGEVTILNASLGEATLDIAEVVVTARSRQTTESALQVLQKKAPKVIDGISFEQISKLGDGNAAQALKRVTGVSVQDGKYVYVRGLSERYTKTTLNGAEIPGLDPEKNTVQMDIFPSNIIENILINKTFSPDMPGESTGGHVDIVTKDFPEKFSFQFSTSFGYNPQTNLNNDFLSYNGSNTDIMGFDNGKRSIPNIAQEALDYMVVNDLGGINLASGFSVDEMNKISDSFSKEMEPIKEKSFLDHSHKLSLGNQANLFGKAIGYNFALSYSRDFDYFDDGIYNSMQESIIPDPLKSTGDVKGSEKVMISGLLNLNYKLSNNNKVGLRLLKNQSGIQTSRYREGTFNYEGPDVFTQDRTLAYLERSLNSYQLHGKHVLPNFNKATIEWLSSYTGMTQDEPDMRFFENLIEESTNQYYIKTNDVPTRYYREMDEFNFFNKLDIEIPFQVSEKTVKIKFGGNYIYKERNLDEVKFDLRAVNRNIPPMGADYYLQNYIISTSNPSGYSYEVDHNNDLINSYYADQRVIAGYIMADFYLLKKLRVVTGARIEKSDMFTENKIGKNTSFYDSGDIREIDVLPSLNLTYSLNDEMNLRMGLSRTLARPQFKEIGTNYYDLQTSIYTYGNNDLERSLITNLDLRYEYFYNRGEKIALSGFYKFFEKPIESKLDPTANNIEALFFNSDQAYLYGAELEIVKKLNFIPLLKDFNIGGNFSYIKSIVEIPEEELTAIRLVDPDKESTRPMMGQAPYIVNAFLSYSNEKHKLNANIGFNISGEKLILITKGATPYIYEQSQPDLNFNIDRDFGENINIGMSVDNILDSDYNAVHHFESGDESFIRYSMGRTFSFEIKYLIK
ncbi:MAG: TonB-dependent receptor domain-containing protein [Thiohalospira sp.]